MQAVRTSTLRELQKKITKHYYWSFPTAKQLQVHMDGEQRRIYFGTYLLIHVTMKETTICIL